MATRQSLTVNEMKQNCLRGLYAAVYVAERQLIAETEVDRFIRERPSHNRGVSARWREYRAWKAGQRGAKPAEAL